MTSEPTKADVYRELRAHHGRMHETLYAMPPQFAVVLGALWYFAAGQMNDDPIVAAGIFFFSAAVAWYLAEAFRTFSLRTQEMRWHIEMLEAAGSICASGISILQLGLPRMLTAHSATASSSARPAPLSAS